MPAVGRLWPSDIDDNDDTVGDIIQDNVDTAGDVIKNNVDTAGDVIEDNFDTFADQEYVCHHLVSTSSDILPDLSFCNFKPDQTRPTKPDQSWFLRF